MRRVRTTSMVLPGTLLALGLLVSACGGSSGGKSSSPPVTAVGGKVTVTAHDIYFDTKAIDASPGKLTITYTNDGAQLHTFVIGGQNFKLSASPHETKTGTVDLKAGTYDYYCDIPGHRGQGMNGQLVVK